MKKNVIRICVFVICIIAIIATRYAYKVLSDVNVTKWDINGNKIYSCSGKDRMNSIIIMMKTTD